jgi:antitoxin MazE
MVTKVQQWGNSLAIRIPKPFAEEAGLERASTVDLSVIEGRLVVLPIRESAPTLEALLAGVTDENLHDEVDTGPSMGNEVW